LCGVIAPASLRLVNAERTEIFITCGTWISAGMKIGGLVMEPIMCPFCGGTNLFQEDDYSLELDFEYWTIHHWECLDCAQSFDKIEILPASNSFEAINNESTIH
jgi:hypothetical protein